MEGLTIRKKVTPRTSKGGNGFVDVLVLAISAVLFIVAMPFILIGLVLGAIANIFERPQPQVPAASKREIITPLFIIHYEYVEGKTISEAAEEYFDGEPLMRYKTEPKISFFEGYFSNFKIERVSGIFVQKVSFNAALTEIVSMPLYFFSYATKEAEFIRELKDYELDTRGGPNNFKIIANSLDDDGEDLEIEIISTIR